MYLQPVAVMLQLMRPAGAGWGLLGDDWLAGMNESGRRVDRPVATWHGCNLAASGKEGDLFMTTELEDAVAKWIDKTAIAEFAKAAEKLKSRDVMASLCEDRQTVMLYLNYDDDAATRTASFMLPEPLAEGEKFDAEFYEGLLR